MRKLSNAILAVILVSALTLTMTFGAMADGTPDISKSADFTISNAYDIEVSDGALTFQSNEGGTEVGNVSTTESFHTSDLEVHLQHNYDVEVAASVSAFSLDYSNSDYSSAYYIPATWHFQTAVVSHPAESNGSGWSSEITESISNSGSNNVTWNVNVDATEGDAWGKISVTAHRDGLNDPQGTYTADLNITVSDLT